MNDQDYFRSIIAINSANLTVNARNLEINEEILRQTRVHEHDNDKIIGILAKILELLQNG